MHQKKEADEFAHIVSHNLRGPVATLKGLLGMYAVTDFTNDKEGLDQFMGHIEGTVKKLDIVVNDLNEILAIKESISKIYEIIDLASIVKHTLEVRLQNEIVNSEAIIKTDFCENVYFLAIRYYVENIVYQLISNAIKYKDTDQQLVIEIKTMEVDSNEICLSVKDNGLGVPNLEKLFQLHQRQHLHIEGTGLGLYLVSTQMKSMGGRVDAISSRGQGAEFLVYFKRT
jgi:signal transduction histidine kinase